MPHDTTTISTSTVTDKIGNPLNFPLAEYSLLKKYDTQKVLDAVSNFVCFDEDWFRLYLTRLGAMLHCSKYKRSEIESMQCFIDAVEELVNKLEAAKA